MSDNERARRCNRERANPNFSTNELYEQALCGAGAARLRLKASAGNLRSLKSGPPTEAATMSTTIGREVWWSQTGSNRRPPACKAGALPTELWPRSGRLTSAQSNPPPAQHADVVGLGRFELPTSRLSSARSNQLSYRPEVRASMRRKRNVGGGVPLFISKRMAQAEARAFALSK